MLLFPCSVGSTPVPPIYVTSFFLALPLPLSLNLPGLFIIPFIFIPSPALFSTCDLFLLVFSPPSHPFLLNFPHPDLLNSECPLVLQPCFSKDVAGIVCPSVHPLFLGLFLQEELFLLVLMHFFFLDKKCRCNEQI